MAGSVGRAGVNAAGGGPGRTPEYDGQTDSVHPGGFRAGSLRPACFRATPSPAS